MSKTHFLSTFLKCRCNNFLVDSFAYIAKETEQSVAISSNQFQSVLNPGPREPTMLAQLSYVKKKVDKNIFRKKLA